MTRARGQVRFCVTALREHGRIAPRHVHIVSTFHNEQAASTGPSSTTAASTRADSPDCAERNPPIEIRK